MVAVVGEDYPEETIEFFKSREIDTEGLTREPGKTFFWSGKYADDFSTRTTTATDLNVFADFEPVLPDSYQTTDFLFLANIHPALQIKVLDMVKGTPSWLETP